MDICSSNQKNKNLKFNVFGDGSLKKIINIKNNVKFWGWTQKGNL